MKQRYFIILGLIILFAGSFFLFKNSKITQQAKTTKNNASPPKEAIIELNKSGFSPANVTISVGGAVRWKNISGDKQTVNSDDYPTNQLHKELNFGVFNSGSSVVYIFTKAGTYGYHNQFHPEQKGKITVISF